MKHVRPVFLSVLSLFIAVGVMSAQQPGVDSTGLPGDQFSLQGALDLFRQSASPEAFEKALNSEDNHVNNLDLDEDGQVDYVRVVEQVSGDIHNLVLQVPVSDNESQDVAVIEIEKTGPETAHIQIVGDEDLYGEEVIIEPDAPASAQQERDPQVGRSHGPAVEEADGIIVNVWLWPSVRFIYGPLYRPWISPWRWHYHPVWFRPWRPLGWSVFYPFGRPYRRACVVVPVYRVPRAHAIYRPIRVTSVTVHTRHQVAVNNFRVTRTRTTISGPRGRTVTRQSTRVQGPNGGHIKRSKTTYKHRRG